MRNNVTFCYPAEFIEAPESEGILGVRGADWFVSILRRVTDIEIDDELCQEDWGVVVFVRRHGKKFWIGLGYWPEGENAWLAHVHHGSFAWLQRFTRTGNEELKRLVSDIHDALADDPSVSAISWYSERESLEAKPVGSSHPLK